MAVVTSTDLNTIRDALEFLLGDSMTGGGGRRALASLQQTVAQAISDSTFTALTFAVEDVDYDGGHSTVTNTDRYTAQTEGWYWVAGGASFAANATGRRGIRYTVNGSAVDCSECYYQATSAGTSQIAGRAKTVYLTVGDILRVEVYQSSGGSLNTAVTGAVGSNLSIFLASK